MSRFKGTGVALITPFKEDFTIDYPASEHLINYLIEGGVDYLVIQGTTGETATLSKVEKRKVLAHVLAVNNGRLPVVYGIGGNNTQSILDELKDTDFEGVDAILSVSPYYSKPSQKGIITHYEKIADHSPVPLILYNIPGRTMSNLTAATTLALSKHPNIIGIKEASGNLEQCMQILANKDNDFLVISGDDLLTTALISLGGDGIISVLANAFPNTFRQISHGDVETSRKATYSLLDINPLMYAESNPVGIKNLLRHLDICGDQVRLPLLRASEELSSQIEQALIKFKKPS
ncbi:4-hydroxy-tetrahydrodipicolinate synthase [Anditalea andensis]|uniref:4-hydroxy-tetrahydrodipicolinate synthase n=1 Tax=Anditalea andensis TaxID=1048983 RepID=A0A074KY32_9BACT|nr:4-hydroxy-tetrahydrodipicolinate synthase [Anditalea andensis]KEO72513.1 dihydrodipicolinate synthase [Anditalea andensis]